MDNLQELRTIYQEFIRTASDLVTHMEYLVVELNELKEIWTPRKP